MIEIDQQEGELRSSTLFSGQTVVVGRDPTCGIVLSDATISRLHAAFDVDDAAVTVRDLASRNGTRVNGTRIVASTFLADGDRIRFGTRELLFSSDDDQGPRERDRFATGRIMCCAGCGKEMPAEILACSECGVAAATLKENA